MCPCDVTIMLKSITHDIFHIFHSKIKATKCTVTYNARSQSVSSAEYEHVSST